MLSSAQVEQFQRDGCLVAGRVIDDAELEELRGELQRIIAAGPEEMARQARRPVLFRNLNPGQSGKQAVWQIVNIWEASDAFERLIRNRLVVEAVAQLCNADHLQVWHDQIQFKPPLVGGVNRWHQDAPYWPIIRPMTPVSAWIALDDAAQDNGCMWMVPGSHHWGDHIDYLHTIGEDDFFEVGRGFDVPADSAAGEVKAVPWPVRAGEVSFHHSLTWHGSYRNESGRPRRAIAIHFMTGDARFHAAGEHVMKQFVDLRDGAPMAEAGVHFPTVYHAGEPVGA